MKFGKQIKFKPSSSIFYFSALEAIFLRKQTVSAMIRDYSLLLLKELDNTIFVLIVMINDNRLSLKGK